MVRLIVELEEELEYLVGQAIIAGYARVEPRKAWTDAERKEAARYYLQSLVKKDKRGVKS